MVAHSSGIKALAGHLMTCTIFVCGVHFFENARNCFLNNKKSKFLVRCVVYVWKLVKNSEKIVIVFHFVMEFPKKVKKNKRSCCVFGCFNNSFDNPDLPFHNFPSNETLKEQWRIICNKSQEFVLQKNCSNAVVCGKHFKKENYYKKRMSGGKLLVLTMKKDFFVTFSFNFLGIIEFSHRLLLNAIPSVFLGSTTPAVQGNQNVGERSKKNFLNRKHFYITDKLFYYRT